MGPKIKPLTHAQLQKAAAKKSSLKRAAEHRQRAGEVQASGSQPQMPEHDRGIKVTHFTKDSGQVEVDYLPPSPTKKRQRLLKESPNQIGISSSSDEVQVSADDGDAQWEDEATVGVIDVSGRISELAEGKKRDKRKGKHSQTATTLLAALKERIPQIQTAYINTHYDPHINEKCPYIGIQQYIKAAIFVECWNTNHFERAQLADLGVRVYLGHHGDACPNSLKSSDSDFRWITLLHTSGITTIAVNFCFCEGRSDHFGQFLDLRLFPGTTDKIKTLFTFSLLDDFHLHTLTSKKAAFDYYDALQRRTNPVLPHKAKNRYKPFLHVARIHRHLAAKRRAGQASGFNFDSYVPHRPPGNIAVMCPACPEPNFNVNIEEIENTPEEKQHIHTQFCAVDGCHSAQRLRKKDDPNDMPLNEGKAIYGPLAPFREFIKQNTGDPEPLTCSRLRAARMQNILKFKNTVVTGIVGAICTRHGLFCPGGVVDMPKGEMYCLADWALYHSLIPRVGLQKVHLSYDLWCLYKIHLPDRLKRWPGYFSDDKIVALLTGAHGCIPQLHIEGHGHLCKACYHWEHTKHTGRGNGELVETPWVPEKLTGSSTRHMNEGHQRDTLDDQHGFWNMCKIQKLAKSLSTNHAQAQLTIEERQAPFEEFTKLFPEETIAKWEKLYELPLPDKKDTNIIDYYMAQVGKEIPTFKSRLDTLLEQEHLRVLSKEGVDGVTLTIAEGLSLDMTRRKLLHLASLKNVQKEKLRQLNIAREKYREQVDTFMENMANFFPSIVEAIADRMKVSTSDPLKEERARGERPEAYPIQLPSMFNAAHRKALGLESAAAIERDLQEGKAGDLIDEVQCRILTHNQISAVKKTEATGQRHHTRSQGLLKTQMRGAKSAMRLYNHNREALLALGMDTNDQQNQPLLESQLWGRNRSRQRRIGESQPDPWYWNISRVAGGSEEEQNAWVLEMNRVKWFCDHATLDRYREELEILEAEYRRTIRFHERMTTIWTSIAETSSRDGLHSHAAYATKQALVYQTFRDDVVVEWSKRDVLKAALSKRKNAKQNRTSALIEGQGKQMSLGNEDKEDEEDKEGWEDIEDYARGVECDDDEDLNEED